VSDLLLLLAEDDADLATVSALCQDMAVKAGDIGYDTRARRVALVGNRFRWEAAETPTRVRTLLRFDGVMKLQRRGWPADRGTVLALLAIRRDGEAILIDFAGGASLRLEIEAVDAVMEDVDGPWGARAVPDHEA
jgi:hypothetical protein